MKLTRGEFCQFSMNTRIQLLREFGTNIVVRKIKRKVISVYRFSGFYVEVYENLVSHKLEKVEPVKNRTIVKLYGSL